MVYGTTLRLPGEMVTDASVTGQLDPNSYVTRLKTFMKQLRAPTPREIVYRQQIHRDLNACPFVFV